MGLATCRYTTQHCCQAVLSLGQIPLSIVVVKVRVDAFNLLYLISFSYRVSYHTYFAIDVEY